MDTKTETVRAITDEMRAALGTAIAKDYIFGWADRIDLALARREAEAAREASEAAERAFERGRASTHSNAAMIREAVEKLAGMGNRHQSCEACFADRGKVARAALAEPPRNCDRFKTANDAVAAYIAEHPYEDEPDASTYGAWLFATAKGGAE